MPPSEPIGMYYYMTWTQQQNDKDDEDDEDDEKGEDWLLYRITLYKKCILIMLHKRFYRTDEDAGSVTLKKRSLYKASTLKAMCLSS